MTPNEIFYYSKFNWTYNISKFRIFFIKYPSFNMLHDVFGNMLNSNKQVKKKTAQIIKNKQSPIKIAFR